MGCCGKLPTNAVPLFNGKDVSDWRTRDGQPGSWDVVDGVATVRRGAGDILSPVTFDDAYIHIEFRCPDMPDATGQHKGNSGVYLQGRYEIQVLDSYGVGIPGKGDCAAIYDQFAPLVNACRPAMEWQTYDIVFRAARAEGGKVLEPAAVTLVFNGITVLNNQRLLGPTGGAMDANEGTPGPLLLQDHGDAVSYRNAWLVHLPPTGSDKYEPTPE